MAQSTIVQRISLDGAEQIKKALADLGRAGEAAIKQINDAVEKSKSPFAGFSAGIASLRGSFSGVAERLKPVGDQAGLVGEKLNNLRESTTRAAERLGVGFVAGAGAATAALVEFIRRSAESADNIGDAAEGVGLSVKAYQELSAAAAKTGIDQERFGRAFSTLATNVAQEAAKETDAITKLAQAIVGTTQQAGTALLNFGKQPTSKLFSSTKEALDAARRIAPEVQASLAKAGLNKSLDEITFSLASLASQSGKSGEEIRKLFDTLKVSVPAGTVFEALGRDLNQVNEVFQRLGIRVTDTSGKAKNAEQIFGDLANAFANMTDPIQRTADANTLFGARIARDLVPLLRKGRDGVDELRQAFADLGIAFTEEQTQIGENFRFALVELGQTIKGVSGQVGLLFAELATPALVEFRRIIVENSAALRAWAADLVERARPAVDDFIKLLRGASDEEISTKSLLNVRDAIIGFRDGVVAAVPAVTGAFNLLKSALTSVADAINSVFGTNLTAGGLAAIFIIGQVTGVLPALESAFKLAAAAGLLLGRTLLALGAPAIAIAGLVALIATIAIFRGDIKKAAEAVQEFLGDFLQRNVGDNINKAFAAAGDAAKKAGLSVGDAFSKAGSSVDDLKKKVSNLPTVFRGTEAAAKSLKGVTASRFVDTGAKPLGQQDQDFTGVRANLNLLDEQLTKSATAADAEVEAGRTAVDQLIQIWTDAAQAVDEKKKQLRALPANLWGDLVSNTQQAWGEIASSASSGIERIITSVGEAAQLFSSGDFWSGLAQQTSDAWDEIASAASSGISTVINNLNDAFSNGIAAAGTAWNGLLSGLDGVLETITVSFTNFAATLQPIFSAGIASLSELFSQLSTAADGVIATITTAFQGLWDSLATGVQGAIDAISTAFTGLSDTVSGVASSILGFLQPVLDLANSIISALGSVISSGAAAAAGGVGLASGGHVHGPAGIDRVPAMLTAGEYVIRLSAVRHYGRELFAALNAMRIPVDELRQKFDLGGLVRSMVAVQPPPLRLAAGGPVVAAAGGASGGILNLTIGRETFRGMTAPKDTFDSLARYARGSAARSTGTKPTWYGGGKL